MIIYKDELGIQDLILNSVKSSINVPVCISKSKDDIFDSGIKAIQNSGDTKLNEVLAKVIVDNPHPDLGYVSAILVSTNVNANDDCFLPEEVFPAVNSIVNTQYDQEHDREFIIGHVIAARILLKNGEAYTGTEIPGDFDVEIDAVLYKKIYPEIAESILKCAESKKQAVSMECILNDYDFLLVSPDGEGKVVSRNEATAFLSKTLRIYGGSGSYGSYKVARILRGIRFTGVANVTHPANSESIYTNLQLGCIINSKASDLTQISQFIYKDKENIMVIENLEQAKAEITKLETQIASYEDRLKTLVEASAVETAKAELQKQIDELTNKLATEAAKFEVATKALNDANAALEDMKKNKQKDDEDKTKAAETYAAELKKYQETAASMTQTIEGYQKAAKKTARASEMGQTGLKVSEDYAVKLSEMTDETYATILEFAKANSIKEVAKVEDTKAAEKDAEDKLKEVKASETGKAIEEKIGDGTAPSKQEEMTATATQLITSLRKTPTVKKNKKDNK